MLSFVSQLPRSWCIIMAIDTILIKAINRHLIKVRQILNPTNTSPSKQFGIFLPSIGSTILSVIGATWRKPQTVSLFSALQSQPPQESESSSRIIYNAEMSRQQTGLGAGRIAIPGAHVVECSCLTSGRSGLERHSHDCLGRAWRQWLPLLGWRTIVFMCVCFTCFDFFRNQSSYCHGNNWNRCHTIYIGRKPISLFIFFSEYTFTVWDFSSINYE